MNIRFISLTLLGLCLVGGLIAGFFSRSIEAALTVPPDNTSNTTLMYPSATPAIHTMPAMPTPMPNGVSILAQDTFQRPNQLFWGTASDGREWDGDANNLNAFSTFARVGQISQVDPVQKTYNALLGPSVTDAQVVFSASVNQFEQGKVNMGAVLRWTDNNNWYKALVDGTQLRILRRVNGVSTQLAAVPFNAQGGTTYSLRFRAVGAMLFARAWPSGSTEPQNWLLTVMDTSLPSGFGGIRVLVEQGAVVRVTSFLETTVGMMI